MKAHEFIVERKKKRKKPRWAAYGPGPYGSYGYAVGYSGDGGGDGGGGVGEDQHPNEKPRPGTKPTMPAGTVKVDVSDVYDWYKLGQHISNLKGLGKHDFGKGPPSTIMAFGSEEEEHEYIKALQKTGLTTTDIDPVDPNQPKSMKKQKVDPTYNVEASYPGNIGMMELAKFFNMADDEQKTLFKQLLEKGKKGLAWKLVQDIVGVKLQGAEFDENFADGKKPGRKGLAKRSGVNTKASVSSLRKTAKNSSGEKARMAHWLANMKAGRAKKNK